MLSKQLQEQIEQEAKDHYGDLPNGIQGIQRGCYKRGAKKYATLYETALARAERAEKALENILNTNHDNHEKVIMKVKQIATQALTPKTGSDDSQ